MITFTSFFKMFGRGTGGFEDPVCGMQGSNKITAEHKGRVYKFCSDFCRQQFQKNPRMFGAS